MPRVRLIILYQEVSTTDTLNLLILLYKIALWLPPSKLKIICNIILSKSLKISQIAEAAEYNKRLIINLYNNLY